MDNVSERRRFLSLSLNSSIPPRIPADAPGLRPVYTRRVESCTVKVQIKKNILSCRMSVKTEKKHRIPIAGDTVRKITALRLPLAFRLPLTLSAFALSHGIGNMWLSPHRGRMQLFRHFVSVFHFYPKGKRPNNPTVGVCRPAIQSEADKHYCQDVRP